MSKEYKRAVTYLSVIVGVFVFLRALVFFESQSPDANIKNIWDALWYSLVTLTTVGYGDFYPVTPFGKIFGILVIIGSLGILSYIIGRVSFKISSYMDAMKTGQFGTKMNKHFIIVGWDNFSKQVTQQIVKSNRSIAVVTNKKDDIDLIRETFAKDKVFALFADYNNYEALEKLNISSCAKVFINFNDDSESLIHIINIKKHYENLDFVVLLNSPDLKDTFRSVGVTYIVSKNEIASKLVASYIFEPDAADFTEDLMETSISDDQYDIVQFKVNPSNPYLQKGYHSTFKDVKENYNAILVGICKANEDNTLYKNPTQDFTIEEQDYLIMMTNSSAKTKISNDFKTEDGRMM
jgi:voltage-gated potassium channel